MWWIWLLVGLASLAGFVVLVLSVPIDLAFSVKKTDSFRSRARVSWLFGLVGKELTGEGKGPEGAKKKAEQPKETKRRIPRFALVFMKSGGLRRNLMKLLWRLLRAIKIREMNINVKVGLGDPADTGVLLALVNPVMFGLASSSPLNFNVEADFQEATFQGRGAGPIRIVPIRFVPPILMFLLSPSTIWGVKSLLRARK